MGAEWNIFVHPAAGRADSDCNRLRKSVIKVTREMAAAAAAAAAASDARVVCVSGVVLYHPTVTATMKRNNI